MSYVQWLSLIVAFFLLVPLASAAPTTLPSDLSPGDEYRLAFYTSTDHDATSGDIADYNLFVTSLANAVAELASLGTTWTLLGSTAAINARDNTSTNPAVDGAGVPIYLLNDTQLATDYSDLWDGTILTPLTVTEDGVVDDLRTVWTGSGADGTGWDGFELGPTAVAFGSPGVGAE
jgi:hypothetical protein